MSLKLIKILATFRWIKYDYPLEARIQVKTEKSFANKTDI